MMTAAAVQESKAIPGGGGSAEGRAGFITAVLLCCAYVSAAGWLLSALHELNAAGYLIALLIGVAAFGVWRAKNPIHRPWRISLHRVRRRFRRLLPTVFLLVAAMVFLGGILYAPNNYDALAYRLPRMLHWLAAGQWIWISTSDPRLNYPTTGWEWIAMPMMVLFRSDRGFFLITAFGFLLLPGLLFSAFRQLGIRRQVAWAWMWILPLGYVYVMQAGSIENDFTGVVFCLMAMHFGLRARRSNRVEDVWLASLAAALLTAAKLSNLPLLLPCLIAVWPALGRLRDRWRTGLAVLCVDILISAAPTVALNQIHTGSWNGDPGNLSQIQIKNPAAGLLGNSLLVFQQTFMPPVLPGAHRLGEWFNGHLPASWTHLLKEQFPRYYWFHFNELPQEEASGLGVGITLLLLLAVGATVVGIRPKERSRGTKSPAFAVGLGAWLAVLFFMAKMGSETDARLLLPYYPLVVLPFLTLSVQDRFARSPRWRVMAALLSLSVVPALILSPSRPLWPAVVGSEWLAHRWPDRPWVQRLATVYVCYAQRHDPLAVLRQGLPVGVQEVGLLAGGDDVEYSLWLPLGSRQVVSLRNGLNGQLALPAGIEWMVIKENAWPEISPLPLDTWLSRQNAKIVKSALIMSTVSAGEETWDLVHLPRAP
jgi:hypothetical protein